MCLQVGDLMPALKGRMADSNKNLIAQALSLLAKLAKAMGRAIAREARPVLGPALRCICDSKANVSVTTALVFLVVHQQLDMLTVLSKDMPIHQFCMKVAFVVSLPLLALSLYCCCRTSSTGLFDCTVDGKEPQ